MNLKTYNWADLGGDERSALLQRPAQSTDADSRERVATILGRVKADGDDAVSAMTASFDGVELNDCRVSDSEIAAANRQLDAAAIAAIDLAISNVRRFHEAQLPSPIKIQTTPGVICERLSHPLDSAGLYVPAGTAPLPSATMSTRPTRSDLSPASERVAEPTC